MLLLVINTSNRKQFMFFNSRCISSKKRRIRTLVNLVFFKFGDWGWLHNASILPTHTYVFFKLMFSRLVAMLYFLLLPSTPTHCFHRRIPSPTAPRPNPPIDPPLYLVLFICPLPTASSAPLPSCAQCFILCIAPPLQLGCSGSRPSLGA